MISYLLSLMKMILIQKYCGIWLIAINNLEKDKEAKHFYKEAYNSLHENVSFLKDYYYYSREIADHSRSEQLYKIIISLEPEFDDAY